MKIHSKPVGYNKIIIAAIVLLGLFMFSTYLNKNTKSNSSQKNTIENSSQFLESYGLEEMIVKNINLIHEDTVCSIYLNKVLGQPTLYYIYKNSLNKVQLEDKFFLHFFLKGKNQFVNMDFYQLPLEIDVNHTKYFIFKKELSYDRINLDSVTHLSTGRFKSGKGKSYDLSNISIENVLPVGITNSFKKIIISLKEKAYTKIKRKRDEALKIGVLSTSELDFVKTKITSQQDQIIKGNIRLKGDWTDHLVDSIKWSFRVKLEKDETLFRMRKFSIQHPKTRNDGWEWLYNQLLSQNNLISLRYDFVNVELQIQKEDRVISHNMGIMAIEESFDKILIENNKRREGVIISFDESLLWEDRKKAYELGFKRSDSRDSDLQSIKNASIKVFNESKVLASPLLSNQFKTAKNLLFGLRNGDLLVSEVFDIDKLALFVAITNLFGGHHGLIWHNLRMYYNPVTNKLEPVAYDSNSGHKIDYIRNYIYSKDDTLFQKKLVEKLELVSSNSFLKTLADANYNKLNTVMLNLSTEYDIKFDPSILEYNSNFIKKQLSPSNSIIAHLGSYNATTMSIEVKNISNFPIEINGLKKEKGKLLTQNSESIILFPNKQKIINFALNPSFVNAFVSKKNKKGNFQYPKDISKIKLVYNILGSKLLRTDKIIPYTRNDSEYLGYQKKFLKPAYKFTNFITIDENKKTIRFKTGLFKTNKTINIPSGYKIIVEKGFSLDLTNNASLILYSPLFCEGTSKSPIRFFSSDSTGRGILVSNTIQKSVLTYCQFSNLSNPKSVNWSLTGAVNFNESSVSITNSVFENNRCEDALNIIRSSFYLDSLEFNNTKSDAFDGDFVTGSLTNSKFINCGNDGIDVSGSEIFISNIEVINSSDKAISIGENSHLTGNKIKVLGGEIGIVSKDLSSIKLQEVSIQNSRLAFSAFQKKSEFGPSSINISGLVLTNNGLNYLIENNSELAINDVLVETKVKNVTEKMYGKEYGKSSK